MGGTKRRAVAEVGDLTVIKINHHAQDRARSSRTREFCIVVPLLARENLSSRAVKEPGVRLVLKSARDLKILQAKPKSDTGVFDLSVLYFAEAVLEVVTSFGDAPLELQSLG